MTVYRVSLPNGRFGHAIGMIAALAAACRLIELDGAGPVARSAWRKTVLEHSYGVRFRRLSRAQAEALPGRLYGVEPLL